MRDNYPDFKPRADLVVDWATYESSKYACERYHFTSSMPKSKLIRIGVWENGCFMGVIIFGIGASTYLSKQFGLKPTDCCEMVRVAVKPTESPIELIVGPALTMLMKKNPGLKMIISYFDPMNERHRDFYKNTDWIYSGKSSTRKGLKYRYYFPLNDDIRSDIEIIRQHDPDMDADIIEFETKGNDGPISRSPNRDDQDRAEQAKYGFVDGVYNQ
jgi:hypothetical protein